MNGIRIQGLGKRYRIGERRQPYKTLRESIVGAATAPLRRMRSRAERSRTENTIWALRDVDLEIEQGEVVGIIGPNGAGKTTLLKILSRITKPTTGRVELYGRVGSLLEVGTGFHPELTGRENIYLNGAILGMRKAEIERKFDEIVAFAEIDRFLDTPVKHYSSGMYVRLAFAVAAHLEPEILVVDEVLAVGDAAFQKKCMGKMGEVGRRGRTVLFVSHNMPAVKALCQRAVLLQEGKVAVSGPTIDVIKEYQARTFGGHAAERSWSDLDHAPGNDKARLVGVRVRDESGNVTSDIDSQASFSVEIDYRNLVDGTLLGASIVVTNADGECVLGSISNLDRQWHGKPRTPGTYRSICRFPENFFPDGQLTLSVIVWGDNYTWSFQEDELLTVHIHETEGSVRGDFLKSMSGVVRPRLPWSTEIVRT